MNINRTLVLAVVLAMAPATASAQDACQPLLAPFNAALATGDLTRIVAAATPITSGLQCPASTRADVARRAALAHLQAAQREAKAGTAPPRRRELLEAGRRFAQPWQLSAALGDVLQEIKGPGGQPDYAAAHAAYQMAIAAIGNPDSTPMAPPPEAIKRVLQLAAQTRALAKDYVASDAVRTRSVRGVEVELVPVPVQFHYKKFELADLTESGRKYATELSEQLTQLGRPPILLVGHTDPVASHEYNKDLSEKRAGTVRSFLVSQGYEPQKIRVRGYGKERPLKIENEKTYTEAEIHQMLRRVEVCFLDKPNSSENCR